MPYLFKQIVDPIAEILRRNVALIDHRVKLRKMSRAAKVTLAASLVVSATTVWAVHYMQIQEREVSIWIWRITTKFVAELVFFYLFNRSCTKV